MNLCNDPDHGALNAERAESRGLRKAWVDLDDKRQILERELAAMTEQRDELRRWTSVNGVIELQRERDKLAVILKECLHAMPCGYIPNHTIENLPSMITSQAQTLGEECNRSDALRQQRDRLAVALEQCREDSVELLAERDWWQHESRLDYNKRYQETRDNVTSADETLQSLTPNTKP